MNHTEPIETISPIKPGDLRATWLENKCPDASSTKICQAEKKYIRKRREQFFPEEKRRLDPEGNPTELTGLALSGGGIRSATFSLGVMQALARHGLLDKFDYLSTVSGGGYIGGAVTWLLSDMAKDTAQAGEKPGLTAENFPFGTCQDSGKSDAGVTSKRQEKTASGNQPWQRDLLSYLRHHGDYLTPGSGDGINGFSLFGVVARGTFLNLLAWIPVFALLLIGMMYLAPNAPLDRAPIIQFLIEKIGAGIKPTSLPQRPMAFETLLWLGIGATGVVLLGVVGYSIATYFRRGREGMRLWWYRLRRYFEAKAGQYIPLILLLLVIGLLPVAHYYVATLGGVLAILAGLASHLPSFLSSFKGEVEEESPWSKLLVSVGSGLVLYGILLTAYDIATTVYPARSLWIPVLLAVALLTGWLVNLNYISIHRFYRDRLMEAFMPDINYARQHAAGSPPGKGLRAPPPSMGADGGYLHKLFQLDDPKAPYHLINTNVILVNSEVPIYKRRGGDSFVLSPQYCGSNATGWTPTETFMGGKMTLPTAVAISGAAVNPNIGTEGVDITRSRFLSLAMSLLNLRLGYWAHHPLKPPQPKLGTPNHFRPGAYSFGNAAGFGGFHEDKPFIQLSDGGHFDNLGLYELIRRRLKLILVCDGAQDRDYTFSDLRKLMSLVEEDFGAQIRFDGTGPDYVLPKTPDCESFPLARKLAQQGHLTATIEYADGSKGKLIYLKTTLLEDSDFKVKAYAACHPAFRIRAPRISSSTRCSSKPIVNWDARPPTR